MAFLIRALAALLLAIAPVRATEVLVLCYHDFPERFTGDLGAVSLRTFLDQLTWMRQNGFTPVSMNQLIAARDGRGTLPESPVLITVDDGYASFYRNAFPAIKALGVPVVFGVVGSWIESPAKAIAETDDPDFKRQSFVTWAQVREMHESGLVEIASHSYDMHRGILANPQGNLQPAAMAFGYDPATRSYESDESLRRRVRADLERNSALIEKAIGARPRVMVWPYGRYNRIGVEEAERAGMPFSMTLDDGRARIDALGVMPRMLINNEPEIGKFSYLARFGHHPRTDAPVRALRLDLAALADADPGAANKKLGALLDRIDDLGISTLIIDPFARRTDGAITGAWFPNRTLPLAGDLLNRVAWQVYRRLNVRVLVGVRAAPIVRGNSVVAPADPAYDELIAALYESVARTVRLGGLFFEDDRFVFERPQLMQQMRERFAYYQPAAERLSGGVAIRPGARATLQRRYERLLAAFPFVMVRAADIGALESFDAERTAIELDASPAALVREALAWQRAGWRHLALPASVSVDRADASVKRAFSVQDNPHRPAMYEIVNTAR